MAGLSLSNTISVLDNLGVQRSRKTAHDWVQKADLQPDNGEDSNQVALDKSVIRINDQQYWLYAAVDPDTNKFLHIRLFATYTTALTDIFIGELRKKHDVDDALFLVDAATGSKQLCNDTASILDTNSMEIGIVFNVSFEK